MARNNGQNDILGIGPRLIEKATSIGSTDEEVWAVAALLGLVGGGIAYLMYKKRRTATTPATTPAIVPAPEPKRVKTEEKVKKADPQFHLIPELPPEIRSRIWGTLPYDDLLNLRLASRFIKDDVDTSVGLKGHHIILEDEGRYDFFQKTALTSCHLTVTQLDQPIDAFLLNPMVLQKLDIRARVVIDPKTLQSVLESTARLTYLKLRLIHNENSKEISQVVLKSLSHLQSLKTLHVKTRWRYIVDEKDFRLQPPFKYSGPKELKTIHLEMANLPNDEVAKWKNVLDNQTCLQTMIIVLGNMRWRFYEEGVKRNANTLEKIVMDGVRGYDSMRNVREPLDWAMFASLTKLKSLDLSCNRGGPNDLVESINFDQFPCKNIEEFFVSRILLPPDAMRRVYYEMEKLERAALDQIGADGLTAAINLAQQNDQEEVENERWWEDERVWEIVVQGCFVVCLVMGLAASWKLRSDESNTSSVAEDVAAVISRPGSRGSRS